MIWSAYKGMCAFCIKILCCDEGLVSDVNRIDELGVAAHHALRMFGHIDRACAIDVLGHILPDLRLAPTPDQAVLEERDGGALSPCKRGAKGPLEG